MDSKPLDSEINELHELHRFEDDGGLVVVTEDFVSVERDVLETLVDNLITDVRYL